jgi:hypothetical protein
MHGGALMRACSDWLAQCARTSATRGDNPCVGCRSAGRASAGGGAAAGHAEACCGERVSAVRHLHRRHAVGLREKREDLAEVVRGKRPAPVKRAAVTWPLWAALRRRRRARMAHRLGWSMFSTSGRHVENSTTGVRRLRTAITDWAHRAIECTAMAPLARRQREPGWRGHVRRADETSLIWIRTAAAAAAQTRRAPGLRAAGAVRRCGRTRCGSQRPSETLGTLAAAAAAAFRWVLV